jgi:acetate---CoA ligase (ADP-forming) subunit beta
MARALIEDLVKRLGGKRVLLEHEVKEFLRDAGLRAPNGRFVRKGDSLLPLHGLPFPLAAKVSSSRITSKSDVRGVRLGLRNEEELQAVFEELIGISDAEGVLVEEMAPPGLEVIVGGIIDPQFGPVVMFGLGGVFVELFRDVSFGLAPLGDEEAAVLCRQVKGYKLLEGYRGRPPSDMRALIHSIVIVSEIIAAGIVQEIDINPLALYPEGAMVLDAKMLLVS